MKRSWLLALLMAGSLVMTLFSPAFADEEDVNAAIGAVSKRVSDLEHKGLQVEVHGFVQSDYISDSTQSFNETVGNGKVAPQGVTNVNGDNGYSQFSLRNSRFSLSATQAVNDWKFKGYMETDFLGIPNGSGAAVIGGPLTIASTPATIKTGGSLGVGGNEYKFFTQPTLRLRHAYVQADSADGWQVLAGQWWTLFGWNMDYTLNTVAEPPVMATLYERIPQLRIQKTMGDAAGMQLQVAISAEKPDQDISQVPTQLAGIRFLMNDITGHYCSSTGAGKMMPLSVGISGRNALFVWGDGKNGSDKLDQSIWASAIAADVLLPVLPAVKDKDDPSVVITGEYSYGSGDTLPFNGGGFGGLSAQGFYGGNPPTYGTDSQYDSGAVAMGANGGLTPIQIQHYNAQMQIFLPPSIGTIFTGGYGEIYAVNASVAQLGALPSFNDDSNWFVNCMQDVTKDVRVALEYDQFMTHYTNGQQGTDNRLQLSTWYRF